MRKKALLLVVYDKLKVIMLFSRIFISTSNRVYLHTLGFYLFIYSKEKKRITKGVFFITNSSRGENQRESVPFGNNGVHILMSSMQSNSKRRGANLCLLGWWLKPNPRLYGGS